MTEIPHQLLRISEATDLLGITRSSLQKLYPHLHILEMPCGSRRLSASYLIATELYFESSRYNRRTITAREFSVSKAAQQLIGEAEYDLDQAISAHVTTLSEDYSDETYVSAPDIADILNLGRISVTDWYKSGAYELYRHDGAAYVREVALRDVLYWSRPRSSEPDSE